MEWEVFVDCEPDERLLSIVAWVKDERGHEKRIDITVAPSGKVLAIGIDTVL